MNHWRSLIAQFTPASLQDDPEGSHRAQLVTGLAVLGGIFGASYTVFYSLIGHRWGAAIIVVCTGAMVTVPFVMRATGRLLLAGNLHALIWTLGFSALAFLEGGMNGHAVAWLAAGVPLLALLILELRMAVCWCAICFVTTLVFCALDLSHIELPLAYPKYWHPAVTAAGYVGFALFMTLLGLIFESSRREAFKRMVLAHEKLSETNARLRASEHFIQSIAGATPGLLYMLDVASLRIVYANERLGQTLGFRPTENESVPLSALKVDMEIFGPALERVLERLRSAGEGAVIESEYRFEAGTLGTDWVCHDTVFSRTASGEPLCILGMALDVSERRRVQEALGLAENRFAAFMQNLPGVAFMKDSLGHYIYASDRVDKVTGLSAMEVLGYKVNDLWPENAARIKALDEEVLRSGRPIQTVETLPMADRTHYWLMHKFPIPDSTGKPGLIGGMAIDITERIVAEQKLEAALRKEEVLRRELHHRVKNNLQVIASLLFLQSTQIEDPRTLELLRESQSRARSIAMIHELLCRSEELSQIDFGLYARKLAADLFLAYRVAPDAVLLRVSADSVLLHLDTAIPCGLIITELISNTLKYAFPGGEKGEIFLELQPEVDGLLKLSFADNGVGLPEGFVVENTTTLGLKLVRDLARQLEGRVEFHSDHGTQVILTFRDIAPSSRDEDVGDWMLGVKNKKELT